jgi:hypothetical protein
MGAGSRSSEGELDHDGATSIEPSDMSSVDGEWGHNIVGDMLLPWGARSRSGDGELYHDNADDGEVDRTGSGSGERTTDAGGINVIILGDGETNANLGDGVQDHNGACDDGEVDRTRSGSGERTTDAGGINVVVVGDWETNGSLGDIMWECDRYQ